jgi:hypothetical protein
VGCGGGVLARGATGGDRERAAKGRECGRENNRSSDSVSHDHAGRLGQSAWWPVPDEPASFSPTPCHSSGGGASVPCGDQGQATHGSTSTCARACTTALRLWSERVRSSLFASGGHSERSFVTWHSSRVSAWLAVSMGRRNRRGRAACQGRRVATFALPCKERPPEYGEEPRAAGSSLCSSGRCVVRWLFVRDGCVRRGRGYAGARRLPRR